MERTKWSAGPQGGSEDLPGSGTWDDAAPTIKIEPVRPPLRPTPPVRPTTASVQPVESAVRNRHQRRRPAPLALRLCVGLLTVVATASIAGLVAIHERPVWFVGLRETSSPILATLARQHASRSSTTASPGSTTPLTISAVVPSSGTSGQRVTIFGSDLAGPGGYVVATFDGSAVPTNCPSLERCDTVVPPKPSGANTMTVRLRTERGISNAISSRYT
jgi:hypothetical protein